MTEPRTRTISQSAGAITYNLARPYLFPCILAAVGMMIGQPSLYPLALIWSAHIGFDRLIGTA